MDIVSIDLSLGQLAIVDAEYAYLVQRYKWHIRDRWRSGGPYAVRGDYTSGLLKNIYMHRFLWEQINGPIAKGFEIDHINGNGLDNRLSNLRAVTHRENMSSQKVRRNGATTSKYVGVYFRKATNKWQAQIYVNGMKIYLGSFSNEDEAGLAYQEFLTKKK